MAKFRLWAGILAARIGCVELQVTVRTDINRGEIGIVEDIGKRQVKWRDTIVAVVAYILRAGHYSSGCLGNPVVPASANCGRSSGRVSTCGCIGGRAGTGRGRRGARKSGRW